MTREEVWVMWQTFLSDRLNINEPELAEKLSTAIKMMSKASCGSCRHADGNSIGVDWFYCMEHEHFVDRDEYCTRYEKEDEE